MSNDNSNATSASKPETSLPVCPIERSTSTSNVSKPPLEAKRDVMCEADFKKRGWAPTEGYVMNWQAGWDARQSLVDSEEQKLKRAEVQSYTVESAHFNLEDTEEVVLKSAFLDRESDLLIHIENLERTVCDQGFYLTEAQTELAKLRVELEESRKLYANIQNCKVGGFVIYHPVKEADADNVFETVNELNRKLQAAEAELVNVKAELERKTEHARIASSKYSATDLELTEAKNDLQVYKPAYGRHIEYIENLRIQFTKNTMDLQSKLRAADSELERLYEMENAHEIKEKQMTSLIEVGVKKISEVSTLETQLNAALGLLDKLEVGIKWCKDNQRFGINTACEDLQNQITQFKSGKGVGV